MEDDEAAVAGSLTDPARFGVVFEAHFDAVWAYLARVAGRDAADDLSGEVFAAAFAGRARFDPDRGRVRAWLFGIASNLLRMRFRTEARARRAYLRAAASVVSGDDDVERLLETIDADQRAARARDALARLKRSDRELLVLCATEELSYSELAAVVGVPVGTIRSRLSRSRTRVRELIEADGKEPASGPHVGSTDERDR